MSLLLDVAATCVGFVARAPFTPELGGTQVFSNAALVGLKTAFFGEDIVFEKLSPKNFVMGKKHLFALLKLAGKPRVQAAQPDGGLQLRAAVQVPQLAGARH